MKKLQKLASLFMAAALSLSSAAALADVIAPDDTDYDDLAGMTFNATVGEFNEIDQTFTLTVYDNDFFEDEDIEKLQKGDIMIVGGQRFIAEEKSVTEFNEIAGKCTNGWNIIFSQVGDEKLMAFDQEDDRRFMHVVGQLTLPAAAGIILEDASDPEGEPVIITGLEEILKIKEQKEIESIGLDYYATRITLNRNMEIEKIFQEFDVAQ